MPYYATGKIGVTAQPLENFSSSAGAAFDAAVQEAWIGNPSQVLGDYMQVRRENEFELAETDAPPLEDTEGGAAVGFRRPGGQRRLTRTAIPDENRFTQAEALQFYAEQGVKLSAPAEGISKRAAQTLADRKREEMIRQDILARAPTGLGQNAARLAAGLAVSLLDPLNVASAFVPVVGPARYASMLERAGTSAWARAGVRARVGALEGAAGAAMLEPFVYAGRTQLQDDYDMSDSLVNLAFGTVLGGGLHAVGGRISDHFRGIQKSLPSGEIVNGSEPVLTPDAMPGPVPRSQSSLLALEPAAPFPRLADITPERAHALARDELLPEIRAELLADGGNVAEPGAVAALRAELAAVELSIDEVASPQAVRSRKREIQQTNSRVSARSAMGQARKEAVATAADLRAQADRLRQQIDANREASGASQDLGAVDRGEIPDRFSDRVEQRAAEIQLQAAIRGALPARQVAVLAGPLAREHALRVAVAQAMSGKVVDVEAVLRGAPETELISASQRQATPESSVGVDFQASEAGAQRVTDEVARADAGAAQADLDQVMQQMDDALKNLEQGGFDSKRIELMRQELAAFDEIQTDAKSLGSAVRAAALCGLRG